MLSGENIGQLPELKTININYDMVYVHTAWYIAHSRNPAGSS